jgi:hypothetical protein
MLIQNGADVNIPIKGDIDKTSLYTAVQYSNANMVKCLLGAGAQLARGTNMNLTQRSP